VKDKNVVEIPSFLVEDAVRPPLECDPHTEERTGHGVGARRIISAQARTCPKTGTS